MADMTDYTEADRWDWDEQDPSQRCEHGTFIGSWWGPDLLCWKCEQGWTLADDLAEADAAANVHTGRIAGTREAVVVMVRLMTDAAEAGTIPGGDGLLGLLGDVLRWGDAEVTRLTESRERLWAIGWDLKARIAAAAAEDDDAAEAIL